MAGSTETDSDPGGFSRELVPVPESDATAFALPLSPQAQAGNPAELHGLLSDVLFGEVIDISDLIPRVLSSQVETAAPEIGATETVATLELGPADGGEMLAAAGHAALTILYDEDILASDGAIL